MNHNERHAGVSGRAGRGLRIGLTGGIACGKSELGRILAKEGAAVLDTDEVAHELIRSGTPVFKEVVDWFGPGVLGADGEIDRGVLGAKVFGDARARAALEAIVHPLVIRVLKGWLDDVTGAGRDAVALVPLLYEAGLEEGLWDAVICVAAPDEAVLKRLRQRGLGAEEARRRIAAQMPVEKKAREADYVVRNEGSLESLAEKTKEVWRRILEKERSHHDRPETRKT